MVTTKVATHSAPPHAADGLAEIDALTCVATKTRREAEVTEESMAILTARRVQFQAALEAYPAAKRVAEADVSATQDAIATLVKELRCRLDEDQRDRLVDIWERVWTEISKCQGLLGHAKFPRSFADSCDSDELLATLAGRIQTHRHTASEIDAALGKLVDEPTALAERVAAVKQDVEKLAAATAAHPAEQAVAGLFAQALVLRWEIREVWNGFPTVASYTDCLNTTLASLHKVWRAIVVLEGLKAERDCGDEQARQRCLALRNDPAKEVMARYEQQRAADRSSEAREESPAAAAAESKADAKAEAAVETAAE